MIVIKTDVKKKGISIDKIIIYQIAHKYCYRLPYQKGYIPMYVGATGNKKIPAGYVRDDVGCNISEKNNSYCELSGLYWMWKNCKADIVGLVHYRRYFGKYDCFFTYHTWHIKKPWKNNWFSILSVDEIQEYMTVYDIIVKKSPKRKETAWNIISKNIPNICEYTRKAVEKLYPEYLIVFNKMKSCTVHFNCNMFIGKKVIVDLYCEWLFKILEEVEKIYYEECGEVYKNREIGYLGEFLFRIWIEYNKVNYAIVNTINIEDHIYALSEVKQIIRDVVKHNKKC